MDKLKTQILLISLMLVLLFSVQSVAAATDGDGNLTSESIDLSICDNTDDVKLSNSPDNILTASNELNVLGADEATYSQLNDEITNGGNTVELQNHYYIYDGSTSTIDVNGNNRVIDGRGAVIDMAGSTIRAFNVGGSGVTIKNLTIKNANYIDYGGAIYFSSSGTVENCNFTNNTVRFNGGAIWFAGNGNVENCNFTNNSAANGDGGAIRMDGGSVENCNFTNNFAKSGGAIMGNGNVTNCNFTNNSAGDSGGAIRMDGGSVENCNFTNNFARSGGAIMGNGNVENCNFTNNKATDSAASGGAIRMDWGNVENCNFTNNSAAKCEGGAIRVGNGNVINCNFTNNFAISGGAIRMGNGNVTNCNFTNNSATQSEGGAIRMNGGSVENCNFTNNSAAKGRGGAIGMGNGNVENCNFTNNFAISGGAIGMGNGNVENCNFTNNSASYNGGAIRMDGGSVENCNFTNNSASYNGGAVYFNQEGNVTNCNFTNNSATQGEGGAIFMGDGNVINCNFTNNSATNYGGAIRMGNGNVTNCNFTNNSATQGEGGAIRMNGGSVENCNFTNNSAAKGRGGAIGMGNGNVENCNFINNSAAKGDGGAIHVGNGNVENCNFTNNSATNNGGAVYFNQEGNATNCNFTNNFATNNGGAIWLLGKGNVTNCNFTGNNASKGSAIYFLSAPVTKTVSNSIFLNNRANAEALEVTKNENNITITFTGNDNLLNAIYSGGDVSFTNVTYWGANGIANTGSSAVKPSRSNKEAGQNITLEIYGYDGSLVDNVTLVTDENGQAIYDLSKLSRGKYKYNAYHPEYSYYTYAGKNDTFTNGLGDFNILQSLINRADANSVLTLNRNYTFTIGMDENLTDGIVIDKPITINGNGYTINALQKARIFIVNSDKVVLNNITFTNATASGDGGAVRFSSSGNVTNCNFTNNTADYGGAVYFWDPGTVTNCNFADNKATYGGAVYFLDTGNVTNCNFTNNTASGAGGAVYFYQGTGSVTNCNFTNNTATYGGAVYFYQGTGSVTNCNFTNNTASEAGGAVYLYQGTVSNCNFTGNTATYYGGAVEFENSGNVTNCNFTNNTAIYGGSVYFVNDGEVANCNFTNNTATYYGGAIRFSGTGTVTNCNFTGNNATTGSAIYFYKWVSSDTLTVSNSTFLNNRANAEALEITKNDNNITITFTGRNNLLNAIYSRNDAEVTFTNVTYWGANGITTVSATMSGSNKATGQNITVGVVVNNELVLSDVMVTNENGMIVLDINAGENYYISTRHDTDSYYTEVVNTTSNNTEFSVNVTSQTTNNKTVNITAKSNIPNEVIKGKLLFILPNGTEITANYGGNGTWWAVHTFDDYGVYEVNASYTGLDNVTINNGTVTINDVRLSVVKSANATEVAYNSTVQFTINITNYGSSNVTGVLVSDLLPEGLTFIEAGVISYDGRYEVVYSPGLLPDLVVPIDGKNHVTYIYGPNDIAQWNITGISGGNSVILLISARANGLLMGNITNEVTVRYQENETDTIVNSTNITVIPANSSVSAEDVEVTYGQSIVVVVSSENATGVSYKVIGADGVVKEGAVNVGENITGLDLAAGEYTVNLTTIVNANYTSANYTSKITVKPANSSVSARDVEVTYGEAIVIPVSVVNAVALYYDVVDKNNNIVVSDIIPPGSNITVSDLAAGSYNVTLITGVDLNHTSVRNSSKIIVKRAGSSVSAEDVTVNYGEAISIPVSSANATEISYSIIDSNTKAVANGTVKPDSPISVSDLAAGDYTVSLATVVDANHTSVSNSSKLHIRHVVTITIAPVTGHAGEVVNFTAQFNYENGSMVNEGTASLTIKYEERKVLSASMYSVLSADESVPVSNGKATFTVKLGEPGRYPYVVSYSGSDVEDAQAESILTILKANTNVSCSNVSGKPADKKNVTVTVLDQDNNPVANGTVTLTLNGKTYNSTVENGTAVLSVELPSPGSYNATVAYDGNDYYNSSTSSISVDVEKVNTNAPSVEDVSGIAGEKTDISVKFVDEYGNPVKNGTATLTIDGKTYTAEVINGTATFKDVVIPENDAVVDVYYQGNDYYNASSATFSIKVKQNNTDENKTAKHVSSEIAEGNATGNPIAMMLLALFVMVITYRKK